MLKALLARLMGTFFHLLYHQLAWSYDAVAWLVSFGQWKTWGRMGLPHLRGQRILELAHGPGHLLVALQQGGLQPIGLDLSPHMGRLARQRLRRARLPARLVRARAQALPFRSGAFDSSLATFPTEFVFDPLTLHETARVLKAGGRLVVVLGISFSGQALPTRCLKWLYTITGQCSPPPAQAWAGFEQAGFRLERLRQASRLVDVLIVVAEKAAAQGGA